MPENDGGQGLSLSLSLSLPAEHKQNLPSVSPPAASKAPFSPNLYKSAMPSSRTDAFQLPSADRNAENRLMAHRINMNQEVVVTDCDAERTVSSPKRMVSSVRGKMSAERYENDGYRSVSRSFEPEDDATERKKLCLSKEQAAVLEITFKEHNTLDQRWKVELGKQLNLTPKQIEVWFQNKRARKKLKQTEIECTYLKHCCKKLTEENKRLQKEMNELRPLKLSPQCYMKMSPPTTFSMCPQCECVMWSSTKTSSTSCPNKQQMTTTLLL